MPLWTKGGLVVNGPGGTVLSCDHCPCPGTGSTVPSLGTSTSTVTIGTGTAPLAPSVGPCHSCLWIPSGYVTLLYQGHDTTRGPFTANEDCLDGFSIPVTWAGASWTGRKGPVCTFAAGGPFDVGVDIACYNNASTGGVDKWGILVFIYFTGGSTVCGRTTGTGPYYDVSYNCTSQHIVWTRLPLVDLWPQCVKFDIAGGTLYNAVFSP